MKNFISLFVCLFGLLLTSLIYADTYEPKAMTELIEESDLIILGEVIDSQVSRKENSTVIFRLSTIHISESVKGKYVNDFITVKSLECISRDEDIFENRLKTIFIIGETVVLFINKINDEYYLNGQFQGKFVIENNFLKGTSILLTNFLSEIVNCCQNHQFNIPVTPPLSNSINNYTSKIAHTGYHLNGEFYADVSKSSYPNINIIVDVDPSGANDINDNPLSFNDLQDSIQDVFDAWHSANPYITLTIGQEINQLFPIDGHGYIYFADLGGSVAGAGGGTWINRQLYELSACLNSCLPWSVTETYPSLYIDDPNGPKDLRHVLTHEIGHGIGLDHCTVSYNTMYSSSGERWQTWARTLENGDKAGAWYNVTKPRGAIGFNQVWSGYSGSDPSTRDPIEICYDIAIPQNITVTIEEYSDIKVAPGITISVYGTLIISNNVTFSALNSGTYWGGIRTYTNGSVNVIGNDVILQDATRGITLNNSNGLSNGNYKLKIINCSDSGIYINSCNPTLNLIECDNTNQGIVIDSSSASSNIQYISVKNSSVGLFLNDGDALVRYSYIYPSNTGSSIYVDSNSYIDLQGPSQVGNNNIDPADGQLALYNLPMSTIEAQYNWWGVPIPSASLFENANRITYSPYLSSYVVTAGAGKLANKFNEMDYIDIAQQNELDGDLSSAVDNYLQAFFLENDQNTKKFIITSMLRVIDKKDKDYSILHELISFELDKTSGWYHAALSYIDNDILVRERKYENAVKKYLIDSDKYKNTSYEVMMLTKAALISGEYLRDKKRAQALSDKAKEVNPGDYRVKLAYEAAGIVYDNTQFEDRFAGKIEYHNINPFPDKDITANVIAPSVTITPNPANPYSTVHFTLTKPGNVILTIYSVSGQKVETLVNGAMSAGTHTAVFDGSLLASGIYLYRFETVGYVTSGKILLVK